MAFMGGIFGVYGEKVLGVLIGNILCSYGAILRLIIESIYALIMEQYLLSYYCGIYVELLWTKNMVHATTGNMVCLLWRICIGKQTFK